MRNFDLQWVVEGVLARSPRPCYHDEAPSGLLLDEWLQKVMAMKIFGILCLLSKKELKNYYEAHDIDLLASYRSRGFTVGHVPIPDYQLPPVGPADWIKIKAALKKLPRPCLIHCSAGIDRTGAAVDFIQNQPEVLLGAACSKQPFKKG